MVLGLESAGESIFNSIIYQGSLGVRVFFAISGFILAFPFANHYLNAREKVNIKKYYIRRLTRLEPPYLITLIIIFIASLFLLEKEFQSEWPHFTAINKKESYQLN